MALDYKLIRTAMEEARRDGLIKTTAQGRVIRQFHKTWDRRVRPERDQLMDQLLRFSPGSEESRMILEKLKKLRILKNEKAA